MARKSRPPHHGGDPVGKTWKVAAYIRLSREDDASLQESESVTNQRAIIRRHIASFADGDRYEIVREYVDDGVSGATDDQRDSFQRMLRDIQRGDVNCVIVKDLARSFRNYSDQGYYLDDWFPRHNVRFISLFHQPLDSYRDPRNMRSIAVPIQGVMNENHCAETSDKVREVFNTKRLQGEHIGSFAPYGYRKRPGDNNSLEVDGVAAAVVREIFALFLQGRSKNAIVRHLNHRGIPCPSAYKRGVQGLNYKNPSVNPAKPPLWCALTVSSILKNQIYCGDMVQGRYRRKSYKIHLQERVPEEEWFVVENTHEAIVSRQAFQLARQMLQRDTRTGPCQQELYLFSGFLRCADCGGAMSRSKVKDAVYYYCRTYKDQSKLACTRHSIRHDLLERAVLLALRLQIFLGVDCAGAIRRAQSSPSRRDPSRPIRDALGQKNRELAKVRTYKSFLYQDWKDGELSREDYRRMREEYAARELELEGRIRELQGQLVEGAQTAEGDSPILESLCRQGNITQLSRELLVPLVEGIAVHEGKAVTIRFAFSNPASQG